MKPHLLISWSPRYYIQVLRLTRIHSIKGRGTAFFLIYLRTHGDIDRKRYLLFNSTNMREKPSSLLFIFSLAL
jgi:hypothetical protein